VHAKLWELDENCLLMQLHCHAHPLEQQGPRCRHVALGNEQLLLPCQIEHTATEYPGIAAHKRHFQKPAVQMEDQALECHTEL